jgi:hypothetical protein
MDLIQELFNMQLEKLAKIFFLQAQASSAMTHSQLLEGLKCEPQTKNNERTRSRGTLLGSQHYKRVKGRAGALGWD